MFRLTFLFLFVVENKTSVKIQLPFYCTTIVLPENFSWVAVNWFVVFLTDGMVFLCYWTGNSLNGVVSHVAESFVSLISRDLNFTGSSSSDYGNANENATWKYKFISFVLLRDYFIVFNFFRNGELSRNQIGRSGVQVKKENENFIVVCPRSPQNLEFVHFTLLFCREWQGNVPKF